MRAPRRQNLRIKVNACKCTDQTAYMLITAKLYDRSYFLILVGRSHAKSLNVASKPVSYLVENSKDKVSRDKALVQKGVGRF